MSEHLAFHGGAVRPHRGARRRREGQEAAHTLKAACPGSQAARASAARWFPGRQSPQADSLSSLILPSGLRPRAGMR